MAVLAPLDSRRRVSLAAHVDASSLDALPLATLSNRAEPLFQVVDGRIAGDTLIIAERSRGEIHLFSKRGAHLRTVGQLGSHERVRQFELLACCPTGCCWPAPNR